MDINYKAAIYSRKSKFTGKGESTETQIEMCREYLKNKYGDFYTESNIFIYEDEGFSGNNLNRPQFAKMMTDAKAHNFSTIICYRLDRISRNISDFTKLINDFENWGIDFISLKEQFDTSSPIGRAMMYVASVFSQLERETIAERIKDNMYELAKDGRWLGGITPTGYRSVKHEMFDEKNGKKKYHYSLEIIPKEIEIANEIFSLFLKSRSLSKTLAKINERNILTKNGKAFSLVTLRSILENPVYAKADNAMYKYFTENGVAIFVAEENFNAVSGIMAYAKTLQKSGKANKKLDYSHWVVSVGQHNGIIDGKTWIKTQNLLKAPEFNAKNNYAALSGIIKCGICGSFLITKKRSDKSGFYYICKEKPHRNCHLEKNLNGICADNYVLSLIINNSESSQNSCKHFKVNSKNLKEYTDYIEKNDKSSKYNKNNISKNIKSLTWNGKFLETILR